MTPAQEKLAALGCLVLGILGVYVSKRPTTDIAFGALGVAGCLLFLAPSLLRWWGNRASRLRVRKRRQTPWTMFSAPHPTDQAQWEVGIRRRGDDDVDLDRRVLASLRADQPFEITVAEEEAKVTATRWTENKIGM